MTGRVTVEICADSVEGSVAAEAGGAHRVELCAGLCEGGTTPSTGTIALTRERVRLPIRVLVRPRGGDFCYSADEIETMRRDVREAVRLGADGIVIGALRPDGSVDTAITAALIDTARLGTADVVSGGARFNVTFHRAFDVCRDPFEALDVLLELGVDTVLTSGQAATAEAGAPLIAELEQRADKRLTIMPGGGITAANARKIVERTGAGAIHLSARSSVASLMQFHNDAVTFSGVPPTDCQRLTADAAKVRAVVAALR